MASTVMDVCGFDVDAHCVAFLALRLRNGQGNLVERGKQRRYFGLKRLAAGGQPDVAPGALEQLRIQLASRRRMACVSAG